MLLNVMGVGQALGPAMPFSAIAVTGEMPSTGLVIRVWHMAAHETNRPAAGLRQQNKPIQHRNKTKRHCALCWHTST